LLPSTPLVIWRFIDGKPGHENQTLGLVLALAEQADVKVYNLEPVSTWQAVKYILQKSFPVQDRMSPTLIIGAGHATHLSVLAAQRSAGGQSVILMKPTLPTGLFNYCIVPEHDGCTSSRRIITTVGVLNRIKPSTKLVADRGLILIGGPSAHYDWHDDAMLERIRMIVERDDKRWLLTSSRRTPDSFVAKLKQMALDNLTIRLAQDTGPDWISDKLQYSAQVWISEDSVSMVYEALTCGAACGLLPVQRKRENRVSAGVDRLVEKGRLTAFDEWMKTGKLKANETPLYEAQRVAEYLLKNV
jgi:mitochondrial fission protein ELM1